MNQTKLFFLLIAALAFASCGSDEPRYADPEAHEKAVQLIVLFATMNFCHLTIGVGKTIFLSNSFRYNWVSRIGQHFCLA